MKKLNYEYWFFAATLGTFVLAFFGTVGLAIHGMLVIIMLILLGILKILMENL